MADAQGSADNHWMRESISRKHCSEGPCGATGTLGLQLRGSCSGLSGEGRVGHSPRFVRERWALVYWENVPLSTITEQPAHWGLQSLQREPIKEESEELVKT